MPLSVYKSLRGSAVPLGFVQVSNSGTAVPLSKNIDANNGNAPGTVFPNPPQFPGSQTEFSPSFRSFNIFGWQPAANNNGMQLNSGNIYLLAAPAGNGSGNRSDSGAMLAIIPPGGQYTYPPSGAHFDRFSPYTLYLDADSNNDGGLVVAYGAEP